MCIKIYIFPNILVPYNQISIEISFNYISNNILKIMNLKKRKKTILEKNRWSVALSNKTTVKEIDGVA